MKNVFLIAVGVGIGFLVAHNVNRTSAGAHFFADLDAKAREFGAAISDGYRAREAELRDAIGDAEDSISTLSR